MKNNLTYSFAHISDVHLGAFRDPILRDLVLQSFLNTMDICIQKQVNFIIIGGDLFDSNLPDMGIVNEAVRKILEARRRGIEIYTIYGSHDFSPNQKSIIDILRSAGLFKKVTMGRMDEEQLLLEFIIDKNTGAKLVGLDGRKLGLDKNYYQILNRSNLEKEKGFKIFVFHGMVSEYKPKDLSMMQSLPLSYFPKDFNYYAGGHLHEFKKFSSEGFGNLVYPGVLFAGDQADLEMNAQGQTRGFCIVTFSNEIESIDFIENNICEYESISYNVSGKGSVVVQQDLENILNNSNLDPKGKIFILKIEGALEVGKVSDVDYNKLQNILFERGAKQVLINSHRLTSKQYQEVKVDQNVKEIKYRIFTERIKSITTSLPQLEGDRGVELSMQLLDFLKQERKTNERNSEYNRRILNDILKITKLDRVIHGI